jgi:hypothetical protein
MTKQNRKFYAWVGQNATTGTPNPVTGRMSMYGDNYVFDNKADRDEFVENYYDPNGNKHAVACTYRELRSYNLGSSVQDFNEWLERRNTSKCVDSAGIVDWVVD